MSKRTVTILAIVFVVLVIIFFVQNNLQQTTTSLESFSELKMEFDPEKVAYIDVFKRDYPDSGLHFAKQDTMWVVTNEFNSPARDEEIEKLLTDLREVTGTIRGDSAKLYPDFDITDERALQIRFLSADSSVLAHVYVGKGGSDGRSCFLRVSGSPTVYLANTNFISRFAAWNAPPQKKLPTDRWLRLSLCDINRGDIASYKIEMPRATYEFALVEEPSEDTLTPPEKIWKQVKPTKGLKLEESKIRSLQTSLSGLRARGVVDPANADKFGLDNPKYKLWASDSLGNAIEISLSDKVNDDGDRYALVKGRPTVYKVSKYTFERLFVTPFKKPDKK